MPKHRIQIVVTADGKKLIDGLRKKNGNATFAQTARRAFAMLDMILDHQAAGGKVVLQNKDGTQETIRTI